MVHDIELAKINKNKDIIVNDNIISRDTINGFMSDRDYLLFVTNISKSIDLNNISSYSFLLKIFICSLILASLVLLVPLGGLSISQIKNNNLEKYPSIYNWSYLLFQLMYNSVAYYVCVSLMSISLKNCLSELYKWIILPLVCIIGVLLIYYFLIISPTTDILNNHSLRTVLPALGCDWINIAIWISFVTAGVIRMIKQNKWIMEKNDLNKSKETSHVDNVIHKNIKNVDTIVHLTSIYNNHFDNISLIGYGKLVYRSFLVSLSVVALYNFVVWFTGFFEENKNSSYSSFLLIIFIFGCVVGQQLINITSNYVDFHTNNIPSLNIISMFQGDCFFIIFERNLFTSITTWRKFIIFTLLHCIFEIALFSFSISEYYENWHDKLIKNGKDLKSNININNNNSYIANKLITLYYKINGNKRNGYILINRNALRIGT